jgi:hypothetical protein
LGQRCTYVSPCPSPNKERSKNNLLAIDPVAKAIAKRENRFLVQIKVDGRCRDPKSGISELSGAIDEECEGELISLISKWLEQGKI